MKRKSGCILPISSLPSEYGVGGFGKEMLNFALFLKSAGFTVWQILPITESAEGNSPYSGESAFAGWTIYIDIESLPERLITFEEKKEIKHTSSPYRVDYESVKVKKERGLKLAFSRLSENDIDKVELFAEKNSRWLNDYAIFKAAKEVYSVNHFKLLPKKIKIKDSIALEEFEKEHNDKILFHKFSQYLFFTQWQDIKEKVNALGIEIFGDMPIYVSYNSSDVWSNPSIFKLNKDLSPSLVAAVPPDYFSPEGQLWGNPIYDYKKMAEDNYQFLSSRIKHNLFLYDILRIDHFRGLREYYAVKATAKSAKDGKWYSGIGDNIWKALENERLQGKIVAEDLGMIDKKVEDYLKKTGFPGMRVFQFGFDGDKNNTHLPYNYSINSVCYTGTHDNNTTLGWLYSLDDATRKQVLSYVNFNGEWGEGGKNAHAVKAIVRCVFMSSSFLSLVPMQDLLGYGEDTRFNIPGEALGNWEFRLTEDYKEKIDIAFFYEVNRISGRI